MILAQSHQLAVADLVVIAAYLLGTIALGLFIGRKMKTGTDFFLAGRQLPWWAIGMSLVATDIGGTDIIGVGGAAYQHGLAVANFEWIGCVPAMIVASLIFIPFLYRTGVFTIPEYLERRYNAGVRSIVAGCWLIFMACNLGIMLLASAKMMSPLLHIEVAYCIWATAGLVGFYTCVGGLAAVVYTDAIQCIVMIGGCLLVLALGLVRVGGWDGLQERLAAAETQRIASRDVESGDESTLTVSSQVEHSQPLEQMQLILPVDTKTPFPWPAIYFGLALILSPAYWIGNQAIVQRSFGARSEFEAKASYIWGALLKNVIPFIIAIPGLIALALFPGMEDGDQAFPRLVNELLPIGVRGLFVAAFLAALMSSIDSYLNSASTIVSNDLYKRFLNPRATDESLLAIGRWTTALLVAWAITFAFLLTRMNEESGIYAIFQTLMAFFQGPVLAVLLTGMLWRRATGRAAVIALIGGISTSVSLYALNQQAVYSYFEIDPLFQISEPFLYFSIWAFLVSLTLVIVCSVFTRPDASEKSQLVVGWRGPS